MAVDAGMIIILITTVLLYIIFLLFKLFRTSENYDNFAYIAALLPANYLWYIITLPDNYPAMAGFGVTGVWAILIVLWIITFARDLLVVYGADAKDLDDAILYLLFGIGCQFVAAGVLPADNVIPTMQNGTVKWLFFYMPNLAESSGGIQLFLKAVVTLLVLMVIIPLTYDLKEEKVPAWVLIIITAIFSIPFGIVALIWVGPSTATPLTLLICVLYLLALIILTRDSGE